MSALDVLLEGLFDYAGMFPPASLSLEETLRKSASSRKTLRRPGIVGADIVVAFDRLGALTEAALDGAGFPKGRAFRACVLGAPLGGEPAARMRQIESLATAGKGGSSLRVVSYEVKLPSEAGFGGAAACLEELRRGFGGGPIRVFIEPDWKPAEWERRFAELFACLDGLNSGGRAPVGLKVRGSGPTAAAAALLARLIGEVNARSLPFKATAGLHHPIVERERYGNVLGFLSLAAALRLSKALGPERFGAPSALECLSCGRAGDFRFAGGLAWREFSIGPAELRSAIEAVPFSIGSCSLDEPDEDLARLFF